MTPASLRRRHILAALAALGFAPLAGCASPGTPAASTHGRQRLLAANGTTLTLFDLDTRSATLTPVSALTLPLPIQYGVVDPARRLLYLACSNADLPGVRSERQHRLTVLRIAADGRLQPHSEPLALPSSAVHLALGWEDPHPRRLFLTFHQPSRLMVRALDADGLPGALQADLAPPAIGVFAHQTALDARGRLVLVSARGNDAKPGHAEDPGVLSSFRLGDDGSLMPLATLPTGTGIGPRNAVFHPARPWVYVAMERGNEVAMLPLDRGRLAAPRFVASTLADPVWLRPRQRTGALCLHPDGGTLYVANRADRITRIDGTPAFAGGENSIAVFGLDAATGAPAVRQQIATRGIEPRTLATDASGTLLAVGNQTAFEGLMDGEPIVIPAGVALFRIGANGLLTYARSESVATVPGGLTWIDIVTL